MPHYHSQICLVFLGEEGLKFNPLNPNPKDYVEVFGRMSEAKMNALSYDVKLEEKSKHFGEGLSKKVKK